MNHSSDRERFGNLLEAAGQMFWEMDTRFRVVYANGLLKRIFGNPVGRKCHEFMAGEDRVCSGCPVNRVFLGEDRAVSERMRIDRQGHPVWLQHTAIPIRDDDGVTVGASELMIDTTQRKLMEEWLRDSEHLYRNLVEQVPDIIFSLDKAGRFTFVNTQVEAFLGHPVGQILETPLKDYLVEDHQDVVESVFQLEPEQIWDEELCIVDADGNRKVARIRCKASFSSDNQMVGIEGVMRDRTASKKLEEDLKASKAALMEKIKIIDELYEHIVQSGRYKAIQEHAAEVAHELRQPLAIIGGFARRMERQLGVASERDAETTHKYCEIIVSEISRLESILNRLVDFTAREEIRREKVDPNDLIEYIISVTEARARDKGVQVKANLGPETGTIPIDPGRFQQLVLNLLCNAIDASPGNRAIEVETGVSLPSEKALETGKLESEGYFEMKIRNDGPVIPPEEIQKVFNPFFTTKEHGTGLGLTVTKKIVEDHTGSISVKSDSDGTTFTVWLPLNYPFDASDGY